MRLIKQPNSWSCTFAALAMLLDAPLFEIYDWVGHDGSKIIHPELTDPASRKGLHIQECIDILHCFGHSMTPIEVEPWQTADGINEFKIEKWALFLNNTTRLQYYLKHNSGLLVGKAKKYWHTMAFDYETQRVYDPNGTIYPFDDCKIDLQIFWIVK